MCRYGILLNEVKHLFIAYSNYFLFYSVAIIRTPSYQFSNS